MRYLETVALTTTTGDGLVRNFPTCPRYCGGYCCGALLVWRACGRGGGSVIRPCLGFKKSPPRLSPRELVCVRGTRVCGGTNEAAKIYRDRAGDPEPYPCLQGTLFFSIFLNPNSYPIIGLLASGVTFKIRQCLLLSRRILL